MRVSGWLLAVVLGGTACASRAPSAGQPAVPAAAPGAPSAGTDGSPGGVGLRIPPAIGDFALLSRQDDERFGTGTSLRYRSTDGLEVDAFVYGLNPDVTRCGAACADSAVRAESAGFVGLIPVYLARGYFRSATVASEAPLPRPSGALWLAGYRVSLAVVRDAGPEQSDFLLYILPGYRVKVRATYPAQAATAARMQRFADELLVRLPAGRTQ